MRFLLAGALLSVVAGLAPCSAVAAAPGTAPARSKMLITPAELSRQLKDPRLVIFQIGPEAEYKASHIPGARYLGNVMDRRNGKLSLELPEITTLDSVLGAQGVGPDSKIVLYFGKDWLSPTTRIWFTLEYMGLGDRSVILDGGFPAWKAANLPVSSEVPGPPTVRQLHSKARPEVVAQADWIKSILNDPKVQIIDARDADFYSGVEQGSFPRAGHIPGARNLYFESVAGEDLRFKPDSALHRLFKEAGYTPGKQIVSYCFIGQYGTAVYFAAKLLGIPVKLYDGSFQDWSARSSDYPVQRDIEFTKGGLISTEELAGLIDKGEVTVIDARSDLNAYLANHLPNAPYLHFETLRGSQAGIPGDVLSAESYAKLLGNLGIRRDKPVAIYGSGDAFNFNATFLAWVLTGFRHPKVYLLDGGYNKWAAEGRPLTRKYPAAVAGSYPAAPFSLEVAGTEFVKMVQGGPHGVLVDVRPADQFAGTAGAQARRGHIPGAISHFWASDLKDGTASGTKVWKSIAELKASYESQGITPDKGIFLYCNTGTEASHAYFALRFLLGYPNVRVYVPSWTAWAERDDLPIETGAGTASTGN